MPFFRGGRAARTPSPDVSFHSSRLDLDQARHVGVKGTAPPPPPLALPVRARAPPEAGMVDRSS
ncbi:hypothetical protein ColTof4_11360 [Colletotrichum tofieldiae]|nr:hypothetical protein ColTof3_04545 [Colletotrichum tofieldiae]GKT78937.1 hypothetical protein ColTof4_11360 [Colletotrichum tofieldiae]